MDNLSYPIGKFKFDPDITVVKREEWTRKIESLPGQLKDSIEGLDEEQLDTPYRPGGWTVRQLIHHLADSHMHAYIRMRLALTEENPSVKTYDQDAWAALADAKSAPVEPSLSVIDGLHARWGQLLHSLASSDFKRTVQHPEMGQVELDLILQIYAWHGDHHVAHILALRRRQAWD